MGGETLAATRQITRNSDFSPRVCVLSGGIGTERRISLKSGKCVIEALKKAGLQVTGADITPDNLGILQDTSIDVFFPALHGEFGEDGRLQQILEDKNLCYTGSGPAASGLTFDKMASKQIFKQAKINCPEAIAYDPAEKTEQLENRLKALGQGYVIKPVKQGSSVGVSIIDRPAEVIDKIRKTFDKFGDCMIEKFIPGKEITVGILGGRALPIIEVRAKNSFYNYESKYVDNRTKYLFDTIDEPEPAEKIRTTAMKCFDALGLRDFARVDFILSDTGGLYVLEANAIPGFTDHSLLPMAAAKAGISMSRLCLTIVKTAMQSRKPD